MIDICFLKSSLSYMLISLACLASVKNFNCNAKKFCYLFMESFYFQGDQ